MSLYDYRCDECDHTFEVLTTTRANASVTCLHYGNAPVDRLLILPASGRASDSTPPTNCRGDGPRCGASWWGR